MRSGQETPSVDAAEDRKPSRRQDKTRQDKTGQGKAQVPVPVPVSHLVRISAYGATFMGVSCPWPAVTMMLTVLLGCEIRTGRADVRAWASPPAKRRRLVGGTKVPGCEPG